jgi:Kef-type K+ transport system membrane component KefB
LDHSFTEIALLVILSAVAGLAGLAARQPLVVPFIAVGLVAGPQALGLLTSTHIVETLSEISIAVLLFLVGLKLDVTLIRALGRVAFLAGIGQILLTAALGAMIAAALGFTPLQALLIGVALSFSSTIIVVKLLSDKLEIDALHGRIALGILIVQDLAVVLGMVALSALGLGGEDGGTDSTLLPRLILGTAALVAGLVLVARYLAEPLLRRITRSPELMVVFGVGWAIALAALADAIGLGKELGGLLAGIALASTPFREALGSRLAGLRDFLLLFFFIHLGATLDLSTLGAQVLPAILLSVFVLIGKPLIVWGLAVLLGYHSRTGFLAGVALAQISEFSLIFMAFAHGKGLLTEDAVGLITLTAMITIAVSAYLIAYSHRIFARLSPWLPDPARHAGAADDDTADNDSAVDYIVFGLGRYGCRIAEELADAGHRVLGIDFDPAALAHWRGLGYRGHFGDATDPAFAAHLPLKGVRAVIAAVPRSRGPLTESDPQLSLLHGLRSAGFTGTVALTVNRPPEAQAYLDQGADMVLMPFNDAAVQAAARIMAGPDP